MPSLLRCTEYNTHTASFSVDVELCINTVMSGIYSTVYTKHVKCSEVSMVSVLNEIHSDKLSEKVKGEIPTYFSLDSTIRNIEWVINYWNLENKDPQCDPCGAHGFIIDGKKRVLFADKAKST